MSGPSVPDLQSAFDNAPIGIAVATPLGVITSCNAAIGRLLGQAPEVLLGGTFFDVTHPDDLEAAQYKCSLLHGGGTRIVRHECRFLHVDGSVVWVLVSTSRVPEQDGRAAHLIMHIEDISEQKALQAELSHRALHDDLTGLPNRTLLADRIRCATPRPGALLFCIDLDGFKAVNDRFGHAGGDEVLRQLAVRLIELLGPDDTAARLGGDEFAVLCVGGHSCAAERFRAAAARPFVVDGVQVALSAAVGAAAVEHRAEDRDPADLLHEADQRMYEAKRQNPSVGLVRSRR